MINYLMPLLTTLKNMACFGGQMRLMYTLQFKAENFKKVVIVFCIDFFIISLLYKYHSVHVL